MNKTLATFLGFQKPSATVVVVNGAQGAAEEETAPTTEAPTTEAAPTGESTEGTAPTTEASPTTETPPTAEASTATTQEGTMVSIPQAELTRLQAAATELAEMKPKYEILNTWYENVKGKGAGLAPDAYSGAVEKKSWEKAPWNN